MGFEKNYLEIDLSTDSTFDVVLEAENNIVYAHGSATGNVAIGVSGTSTPRKGMKVEFIYNGVMGANTLTVFGTNVPVASDNVKALFTFYYNGSSWLPLFNPSTDTAYLNNSQVKSDAAIAVNKLATLTASRIPQISASGVIEPSATNSSQLALLAALTAAAADYNKVAAFTGTTANLNRVAGGSWTSAQLEFLAGVTSNLQTQLNAKANTADFSGLIEIRSFSVTIPSADVLTMNASPITLVPAQGAGLGIELICATGTINYNSVPYDTNTQMRILCQTGAAQANFASLLLASSTQTRKALMTSSPSDVGQGMVVANQPLQITVHNGEALNGDSSLVIRGLFRVIQVP